jgi:hypothetical protein
VVPTTIIIPCLLGKCAKAMEGSHNGKCGKICSITTKFGGNNKRTLDAYGISVWGLNFEK